MKRPALLVMLLTTATLSVRLRTASAYSFVLSRSSSSLIAAGHHPNRRRVAARVGGGSAVARSTRYGGVGCRASIVMWGEEDTPSRLKGEGRGIHQPFRRLCTKTRKDSLFDPYLSVESPDGGLLVRVRHPAAEAAPPDRP